MVKKRGSDDLVLVELYVSKVVPRDMVEMARDDIAELVYERGEDLIQEHQGQDPDGEPLDWGMVSPFYQELAGYEPDRSKEEKHA